MRITLGIILYLLAQFGFAQNSTDKTIYLDSTFYPTMQGKHYYYRVITDYHKKQLTYRMTVFYKSGEMYSEGYSKLNDLEDKIGKFTYYYKNGNPKEIINYEDFGPFGAYFSWYEDGQKKIEGEYLKPEKEHEKGVLKINQYWDTKNTHTVVEGNGYYECSDKNSCEEGNLINGFREGVWAGSNYDVTFTYVEKYANQKLIAGVSQDKNGVPHIYREVETKTEFEGGMNEFYKYVMRNFHMPEIEGLKGKLFVAFTIQTDGSLDDITIIRSMGSAVDQEAYRMLSISPDWKPAKNRGINVPIKYTLPINIETSR
jgi:antitoxin component YwqK of YwqJK toxin-antitoxin module